MTNHNVSVTGGTDRLRFRLSGNYSYEDGPLYTSKDNYRRYVLNSFVSADITKWFTQEATIIYTNTQSQSLTGSIRDVYATRLVSWYPEGYMPKEIIGTEEDLIIDSPRNALEIANTANTTGSKPRIQLKTIIKPLEGWSITGEYTFLSANTINRGYTGITRYADVQLAVKTQPSDPTKDQYWILNQENKYHALNLYSNYDFEIGKHKVGLMVGFNQESSYYGDAKATIEGQSVPTVPSFGGGTGEKYLSDSYSEFAIRGAFGRLTYNYDNRYLLNVNARYDGSSKFPKSNRFGFFPSVSVGWRIANESFMDWSDRWLDDFKIRASYGEIGNQSIAPYGFVPQMTIGQSSIWIDKGGRITYIDSPELVRANYTWERVSTLDVGYDLTAFSGRLNSTFSWYRRNTLGMLAPGAEIPAVIGAEAPQQNVADLSTKGWELSVNWRDVIGNFRYSVGFNLYDHRSFVTKYLNLSGNIDQWYAGEELGNIWGMYADRYYDISDFDLAKAKTNLWVLNEGVTAIQGVVVKPGDIMFKNLYGFGTGPIRGFATTLIIGLICSFLTAVFLTRLFFEKWAAKGKLDKTTFTTSISKNFLENTNFDFVGRRKVGFGVALGVIAAGLIALFTVGLNSGIDFTGGRNFVVRFDKPVTTAEVTNLLSTPFEGKVTVITISTEEQVRISTNYKVEENTPEVDAEIENKLYEGLKPLLTEGTTFEEFTSDYIQSSQKVGASMADDIKTGALIAVVLSLIVMAVAYLINNRKFEKNPKEAARIATKNAR